MKRFAWVLGITVIAAGLTAAPAWAAAQHGHAAAAAKSGSASGKVTAVDTTANTIVVDVGQGKKMSTVAGPLAPKATLTRSGKTAKLSDFKSGDNVSVSYSSGADGPVINKVSAK